MILRKTIFPIFFVNKSFKNKEVLQAKFTVSPYKMSESNGNITAEAVLLLTTRLGKAEQRLKVLTREITSIKKELATIQQRSSSTSTGTRQLKTWTTRAAMEIDGPNITSIKKELATIQQRSSSTSTGTRQLKTWTTRAAVDIDEPSTSSSSNNGVPESKRPRYDFSKEDDYVVVYTDGACENNGSPNAKAGIGVWFGYNHPLNLSQPITGRATNNRAEIHACVQAITIAHRNGIKRLKIKTDSRLVVQAMTNWMNNWKKNNWKAANKKDVKNKEDFVLLDKSCQLLDNIEWEHVRGHNGVAGNEEADKLASAGAMHYKA